jgi:hypothetical protein
MTTCLFGVIKATCQAMMINLIQLLDEYFLGKKSVYVKNEKSNLNIITTILKFVINCEVLDLEKSFQSTYFGHVFLKSHQYATIDVKSVYEFQICFIMSTQAYLQKCMSWFNNYGKGI